MLGCLEAVTKTMFLEGEQAATQCQCQNYCSIAFWICVGVVLLFAVAFVISFVVAYAKKAKKENNENIIESYYNFAEKMTKKESHFNVDMGKYNVEINKENDKIASDLKKKKDK